MSKIELQLIEDQTPEICLAAVRQDGTALQFVKEQTPEICLAAVRQNIAAFDHVKIYSPDLVEVAKEMGVDVHVVVFYRRR